MHMRVQAMSVATERIPILVTPSEKKQIARMARAAGLSMGEYLRRAAASFRPAEDDALLEGMIGQMAKTTARASAAIDDALRYVEASNKRIRALKAQQDKIENLTERVIRLETALEIALARPSARSTTRLVERKE